VDATCQTTLFCQHRFILIMDGILTWGTKGLTPISWEVLNLRRTRTKSKIEANECLCLADGKIDGNNIWWRDNSAINIIPFPDFMPKL
jgi:hypothetical protein